MKTPVTLTKPVGPLFLSVFAAAGLTGSASALNVAGPAYGGTGISGVNDAPTLSAFGTSHQNNGTAANINDGNFTTRVDTFFPANPDTYSFVGIRWPFLRADSVKTLTFTIACFSDGGWFGPSGSTPGPGNPLSSAFHLVEPRVQVTTDGGATWTEPGMISGYLTELDGHPIGGGAIADPNPRSFTLSLATPASGINGVRLIGPNGGPGDGNGYLGIFELAVDAGPVTDTDNDGMEDAWEAAHGGMASLTITGDLDADGLSDVNEFLRNVDPQDNDSDNDGLSDGVEVNMHGSNPGSTDSDGDQYLDALEVARGFSPASSSSRPQNIAFLGTGYMGVNDAIDTDDGTLYVQGGPTAANLLRIVDENLNNSSDTYSGTETVNYSFTGVKWTTARALPVARVEVTLICFGDGGWWGQTNNRPGLTGDTRILGASNLPFLPDMPVVQVTTTATPTWTTVPSTTNYDTAEGVIGHPIAGGSSPNTTRTVSFNITTPVAEVTGVRVIGREGGTAGPATPIDGRGFLGVREVVVKDTFSSNDLDGDGLANADEVTAGSSINAPDSDFDGLNDRVEVVTHSTSPTDNDDDDDGFVDGAEIAVGTNPKLATSKLANIARAGIGTSGINNGIDTDNGAHVTNSANPAAPAVLFPTNFLASTNVNDANVNSRIDTFSTNTTNNFSFVGVRWPNAWPQPVSKVELTMATFLDGGWFGPNAAGPGSGGALDGSHLIVPTLQITTDGIIWSAVPGGTTVADDYITKMTGHVIGGGPAGNPTRTPKCTFAIDPPIPPGTIKGIRLIGREGGTAPAGAAAGFLGIYDLAVQDTTTTEDPDGDGLTNTQEAARGTDPNDDDSDDDGLNDGAEVNTHLTNPLNPDHDGDHFRDGIEVQYAADPASALSFPANIALIGTGIMGINDAIDSDAGTVSFQAGVLANLNDGNHGTRVDTYNGAGGINSFTGILWSTPQTVKTLKITFATFFDGGWFGVNGTDPGAGGALNNTYLVEPYIQVSTDGGVTWTTVEHESDYLTALNGHNIGGGAFPNPSSKAATFTLTDAAAGVTGMRIIGQEGGTASGGFLGAFEVEITSGGAGADMDNDGLADAWEVSNFGYVHAQHLRGDPDGDGSDNLLERAFGMNPNTADQPPAGVLEAGYLTMTISKVSGIAYSVLSGSDLTGFSTLDTTVLIDDATTLKVRDNTLISTGSRRFLKATVAPAP